MTRCYVQAFDDTGPYERAFVGAATEITPTGRGPTRCQSTRIVFDRLWLARASESMPRVRRSTQSTARAFFRFLPDGATALSIDGTRLPADGLMVHPPGHAYFEHTAGPTIFAVLSLPRVQADGFFGLISGCDPTPASGPRVLTPAPGDLARLRLLLAEATFLAETNPGVLARPAVTHSLEQALLDALGRCLAPATDPMPLPLRGTLAMRRFFELLDAAGDQPVHVPDICEALGIPERTFRSCCQTSLGMSPHAYLLRRRLHLARAALREPETTTTVTDVATRFGFWHFGRFARDYRATFGEVPSATLRTRQQRAEAA